MAKAPKPGESRSEEEVAEAQQITVLTIRKPAFTAKGREIPQTHRIGLHMVPIAEHQIFEREVGVSIERYFGDPNRAGMLSFFRLWWLARRINGEVNLTHDKARDEFPSGLGPDDIDISSEDPAESESPDPEA
jgi:hypothetical protein